MSTPSVETQIAVLGTKLDAQMNLLQSYNQDLKIYIVENEKNCKTVQTEIDTMKETLSRQKGVMGGAILVLTSVWSVILIAVGWFKENGS